MNKLTQSEIDTILNENENKNKNRYSVEKLFFESVDFSFCNFTNRNLYGVTFKDCILDGALFYNSNLQKARFLDISAEGTSFIGANLRESFINSDNFDEATDFSYCNFQESKFITGSNLLLANFNRSSIHLASEIPTNFVYFSDARNNLCALYADHHYNRVWTDFFNGELDQFKESIIKRYGNKDVSFDEKFKIEQIISDEHHPNFFDALAEEYKIEIFNHRPFYLKSLNLFLKYKEIKNLKGES